MQAQDGSGGPLRLPHSHTNDTFRHGDEVVKEFAGPDAQRRAATEARILRTVADTLPVPAVHSVDGSRLRCEFVNGRPAQDVFGRQTAAEILSACGRVLAEIHAVPAAQVAGRAEASGTLVHGDFGPNNVLLRPDRIAVAAVVDWEWAHFGEKLEDLAWCEWIVRIHHPECVDALPHLYHGYGAVTPPWSRRRAAMLAKCRAFQAHAARRQDGSAAAWQRRTAITASWR